MTINEAKQLLTKAQKIDVLTGAGMSTESGLPDFRSINGIYKTLTTALTFNIRLFRIWPRQFYKVIGPFYKDCISAEPNAGHLALAELERQGKIVEIATQNVDCLHQKAGSTKVYGVHGTIATMTCMKCGEKSQASDYADTFSNGKVPHCSRCGGVLKPDLTFFGEELPSEPMRKAKLAFLDADLVMILGTSLQVSPANTLPGYRVKGTPMFIINHDPTQYDEYADFVSHEKIGEILPQLVGMA